MAVALETLAAGEQPKQSTPKPTASRQSQAMVWALTTNCTDINQIAAQFGVTRRTVERWSQLRSLIDNLQHVDGRGPTAGFMTTNGVEGVSHDDDDWG